MAISETARKKPRRAVPNHVSTLKDTDPELIEVFDNFAFDEVLRYGSLDTRTRLMVQLASLIACQALAEYRVMLGAALGVGITPVEAKEIVYQAVPYVGMARVFDFMHATNDVLSERGIQLPLEGQATTTPQTRAEKGLAVQQQIVGADRVERMYVSASDDERRFQQLLSANCFGDHYTRTGIDIGTQELLTFAMLVALGGCEPQAKGHVVANLNVGNDRGMLSAPSPTCLHRLPAHPERPDHHQRGDQGMSVHNTAARSWLITGVSSGFGHELTRQLLERGERVVGTVRQADTIADLLDRHRTASTPSCST